MSPRPILKRTSLSARTPNETSPHHAVHFPTTSSLTTHTYAVYSSAAYDRTPIAVSPNSCAMPARGCPGRTYTLPADPPAVLRNQYGGGEYHPRALNNTRADVGRTSSSHLPPPLIPDLSSESDESDGFTACTPHEPSTSYSSYAPPHMHGLVIPKDKYMSYHNHESSIYDNESFSPTALSFLPHPPCSPTRPSYDFNPPLEPNFQLGKPKRRRERRNDSSRSPDRIPSGMRACPESPLTPTNSGCKSRISVFRQTLSSAPSSFRVDDDGCLGGF